MKKLFAVISGASLLLSVGLGNVPGVRADSACTNATLTGGFGIQSTGTLVEGGPGPAGRREPGSPRNRRKPGSAEGRRGGRAVVPP